MKAKLRHRLDLSAFVSPIVIAGLIINISTSERKQSGLVYRYTIIELITMSLATFLKRSLLILFSNKKLFLTYKWGQLKIKWNFPFVFLRFIYQFFKEIFFWDSISTFYYKLKLFYKEEKLFEFFFTFFFFIKIIRRGFLFFNKM